MHSLDHRSHLGIKMARRGKSDHLTREQCIDLENSLRSYIADVHRADGDLWRFGVYGSWMNELRNPFGEKSAPVLPDLLAQKRLWSILLQYMPGAKMKDSQVGTIMTNIASSTQKVNNTKHPDAIFVTWFCKSCHLGLTHLRSLARYPERYAYRTAKLNEQDGKALTELLRSIVLDPMGADTDSSLASPSPVKKMRRGLDSDLVSPCKERSAKLQKVFASFLHSDQIPSGSMSSSITPQTPKRKQIPQMFLDEIQTDSHHDVQSDRRPSVPKSGPNILASTLATPPLPAGRGEIWRACEATDHEAASDSKTGCRPYVERALSGNVRTTMRVACHGDPVKRMWCEVRARDSPNHEAIVRKVADMVRQGKVLSKQQAQAVTQGLLRE